MAIHLTRRALLAGISGIAAASAMGAAPATAAGTAPAEPDFVVIPTKVYPAPDAPDGLFPLKYRKLLPPSAPRARYPGFSPGTHLLKAGTIRREGALPLPVDIIFERDVPMTLRDGTVIYTNIFRPPGGAKVPAIFSWSPYGKDLGGQWLDDMPDRQGVPLSAVSELQRFEGADPAYWCQHGYAVVNPDPRGALMSGGNVNYWGRQLAEDGYDFIEWNRSTAVVQRQGCHVGQLLARSLAMVHRSRAAAAPAAIAPWEGLMDQGPAPGIPASMVFGEIIAQSLAGKGYIEDQSRQPARLSVDECLLAGPPGKGRTH